MYRIGIIGCGIVGKATANGFMDNGFCNEKNIRVYDKFKEEVNIKGIVKSTLALEDVVRNSRYIFVSLPTPYKITKIENINGLQIELGESDLSILNENIEKIVENIHNSEQVIIIRSTVPPGTTKNYSKKYSKIRFCFNPEFLREAHAYEDFLKPDRIVIGADDDHTRLMVADPYRNKFPNVNLFLTNTEAAEMVKYMANITLATIITIGNQMFDICNKLELNYDEIKKMVVADSRLSKVPLDVTSERGFGGKCFPKDLVAMIGKAEELGVNVDFLKSIWTYNLGIRKNKDWHDIPWARTNSKKD